MYDTQDEDRIGAALVDLISLLASPQRDDALLREAGVRLDRALFPLLVMLGREDGLSVGALAERVGRDSTTVSRQVAKLEGLGLVVRRDAAADRRQRPAHLTPDGSAVVAAIAGARRRLLRRVLGGWDKADRAALARLIRRFADSLAGFDPGGG